MTDTLAPVAVPNVSFDGNPPNWIAHRGQDCRAYDRRLDRPVWGPAHAFARTSDLLFTNGQLRATCGLDQPYLSLAILTAGAWTDAGVVSFEQDAADRLYGVRIVRLTQEAVTVALDLARGLVLVTLRRGERMLRIRHGRAVTPVYGGHYARVRGFPPHLHLDGTPASAAAKFGNGIDLDASLRFPWPASLAPSAWTVARWWKPDSESTAQADSGLWSIEDDAGDEVMRVWWDAAVDKLKFWLAGTQIESAPLAWTAGQFVGFAAAFDTTSGMSLTWKVHTAAPVTESNVNALDPGATTYASFDLGIAGTGVAPEDIEAGEGPAGGAIAGLGLLDNADIFEDRLTEDERVARLNASSGLAGLPSPSGRLVWHAPFDCRPMPLGSALATGRRYEATVEGGTTRNADASGLTRVLLTLENGPVLISPFALGSAEQLDVALAFATTGAHDDIADVHAQFAAANEQETRIRA